MTCNPGFHERVEQQRQAEMAVAYARMTVAQREAADNDAALRAALKGAIAKGHQETG